MADTFIWYELMTSVEEAALAFYKAVVGWTAADHPSSAESGVRYSILSAGGRGIGGMMQLTDEMRAAGARPGWLGYIGVADTDERVAAIQAAGGSVHVPPTDIPGVGRFALVADPGGTVFYLLQPKPPEGAEPPPELAPTAPGLISWHELYAGQGQQAAFDFYSAQFGWESIAEMDMGPMGVYRVFGEGETQMGGMMDKPEHVPASAWGFYINVDGIDAAVERVNANGGQIVRAPHEVPGGSWIVLGMDPQGASFALVSQTR